MPSVVRERWWVKAMLFLWEMEVYFLYQCYWVVNYVLTHWNGKELQSSNLKSNGQLCSLIAVGTLRHVMSVTVFWNMSTCSLLYYFSSITGDSQLARQGWEGQWPWGKLKNRRARIAFQWLFPSWSRGRERGMAGSLLTGTLIHFSPGSGVKSLNLVKERDFSGAI